MRFLFLVALASFIIGGCDPKPTDRQAAPDDQKTEAELMVESVEVNSNAFMTMIDGLTAEQLAFRESDDRWSISEIAEHIILSERGIHGSLQQALDSEPLSAARPDTAVADEQIASMMADRTQSFQAPPTAQPEGTFKSTTEIAEAFDEARSVTMELMGTPVDFRAHFADHPAFGPIDAQQWIVFLRSHCDRHLAQMQQVKDHENYPDAAI